MSADIKRWIKRAKRLMADCPEGHWLFVANGNLHVVELKPDGSRFVLRDGGMDTTKSVGVIAGRGMKGPSVDGGDW